MDSGAGSVDSGAGATADVGDAEGGAAVGLDGSALDVAGAVGAATVVVVSSDTIGESGAVPTVDASAGAGGGLG